MDMRKLLLTAALPGLCLASAMVLPAAPGIAQSDAPDEIIVTGRWSRRQLPDDVQSASQSISYADLDLSTGWGRHELKHRINLVARYLCDRLGEPDDRSSLSGSSCREDAARDAMKRVGTIEESWAPRHTAWVRGPSWHAPYADDWAARYPDDPY
ncbi:UrcA family protein [Sphingomonas sp. MMS24-J13]|uniref:UrcA family protein n=1 Tax=Sphingomonas sp. MMS24-J13 TaxID=3238686 RepID=UPI00384BFA76